MRPLRWTAIKRWAAENKAKDEEEREKSKMLGGPGHMVGSGTLWWRLHTSPELHLPFSCS